MTTQPDAPEDIARRATAHNYGQTVFEVEQDGDATTISMSSWPRAEEARKALVAAGWNAEHLSGPGDRLRVTPATTQPDATAHDDVEAVIPWLGDLVTFAVGAYAETMVGAREAGDPSDWAESVAREFCEARRPVELAARIVAAQAEAWDAGVRHAESCAGGMACDPRTANPIRAAQVAQSGSEEQS